MPCPLPATTGSWWTRSWSLPWARPAAGATPSACGRCGTSTSSLLPRCGGRGRVAHWLRPGIPCPRTPLAAGSCWVVHQVLQQHPSTCLDTGPSSDRNSLTRTPYAALPLPRCRMMWSSASLGPSWARSAAATWRRPLPPPQTRWAGAPVRKGRQHPGVPLCSSQGGSSDHSTACACAQHADRSGPCHVQHVPIDEAPHIGPTLLPLSSPVAHSCCPTLSPVAAG